MRLQDFLKGIQKKIVKISKLRIQSHKLGKTQLKTTVCEKISDHSVLTQSVSFEDGKRLKEKDPV